MEALQKEPLSSDSEDEDYVPPEVKEPTLSLRKRSGGLELESDDDDDDDILSDDADIVDAEVAQLYDHDGAGPSSAGAGPSSAGAGPSGAAAGPSGTGVGPSGAGAGSSGLDAGIESSAARYSIAAGFGAESSATVGVSAGTGASAMAGLSSIPDGIIVAGSSAEIATGAAAKSSERVPVTDANGAPGVELEEPMAKRPRVEPPVKEKSIDDIWADMNAGVTRARQPTTAPDASLAAWLEPSPLPKKEFKITRLSELEKAAQREQPMQKKKGRTGLEGVLDVVRGKSETVIEKTKEQWKDFKKDEHVHEELEKYKKDKDRYTDKVAFLQRSDVREWEYEQRGKKRR